MNRSLFVVLAVAAAACDRQETPETAAQKQQLADARATCVALFQKQRTCTDQFIPALVDLRREIDRPAGIAQSPREELIPIALEEWKTDSTDDAIGTQCDRMASDLATPMLAEAKRCNAMSACGEFTACVIPMMREKLKH